MLSWVSVTCILGESVLAVESTTRAYQLRDRATDREKFFITANYHRNVTGNLEQAQQTFELWSHTYPRDVVPHGLSSGFTYQGSGKYEKSIEKAEKAVALDPDATPAYINLAFSNVYLGRLQEAEKALQRASERDVTYGAAFALALAGDSSRSQALADDLQRRFPEDTSVRFSYLPTLRALFALHQDKPADAIELLEAAVPNELGIPAINFVAFFGSLYSAYVRGHAYLAANRNVEAAGEFQKILAHPGLVLSDPVQAMACLQLGRALALSGDTVNARKAYHDFLALWNDADPDIPILKDAKAEFAKLEVTSPGRQ